MRTDNDSVPRTFYILLFFLKNYYTDRIYKVYWDIAKRERWRKSVDPLQAPCDPGGSRRFRLPDFHDIWHMKVVRSSASRTDHFYPPPQECSWYSFSLGAESIPGPWCG